MGQLVRFTWISDSIPNKRLVTHIGAHRFVGLDNKLRKLQLNRNAFPICHSIGITISAMSKTFYITISAMSSKTLFTPTPFLDVDLSTVQATQKAYKITAKIQVHLRVWLKENMPKVWSMLVTAVDVIGTSTLQRAFRKSVRFFLRQGHSGCMLGVWCNFLLPFVVGICAVQLNLNGFNAQYF